MKKKTLAIGAVVAAATGYVAGILTAPKSGKETRKDIREAAVKAKTEAEKTLKKLYSDLSDLIEKAIGQAKNFKKERQQQLLDAIEGAQSAKSKVQDILSALHEGEAADDKDLKKAIAEAKSAKEHLQTFLKKSR